MQIELKMEWVSNFYAGKRGDVLLIAEFDDKIVRFLLILFNEESMVIDLVAADERYSRGGLAGSPLMYMEMHFSGSQRIIAGT